MKMTLRTLCIVLLASVMLLAPGRSAAGNEPDPFESDVWTAANPNPGFEIELLTYNEIMALPEMGRRTYLLGLQRMIRQALETQAKFPYLGGDLAASEGRTSAYRALAWISAILPQAIAADADAAQVQKLKTLLQKKTDLYNTSKCLDPGSAAYQNGLTCPTLKADIDSINASIGKIPVASAEKELSHQEHLKERCDSMRPGEVETNNCNADSNAKINKAKDDLSSAKLSQAQQTLESPVPGPAEVVAAAEKSPPGSAAAAPAAAKAGKSCAKNFKPLTCAAPGTGSAAAKKRTEALKTYQSKVKRSAQCMYGFMPSSASSGTCLAVHSVKIGDVDLKCEKTQTVCNPWPYSAKQDGADKNKFSALCADIPASGTAKEKALAIAFDCSKQSGDNKAGHDAFLKAPINGVKEGLDTNVTKSLQKFCGGPVRLLANCEMCSQMATQAQVAISASGAIRKCSVEPDAPGPANGLQNHSTTQ